MNMLSRIFSDLVSSIRTTHKITQNVKLGKPFNTNNDKFLEENIRVKDPLDLFEKWFQQASKTPSIIEPNAMCLSTATKDGIPSARMMLCKGYGRDGFRFYTYYSSRKGQELDGNPKAALTFFWEPLSKLVRIEGCVQKLPISCADESFKTRPYVSQIGALSSQQSELIEHRQMLENKSLALRNQYKEGDVPRPESWGGYNVIPMSIEFWQGQPDRIHDRIRFRKPYPCEVPDNYLTHPGEGCWIYERLQP